ncbi:MAG: hypothetical protein WCJ63_00840 [Actinomycetes bacterium]
MKQTIQPTTFLTTALAVAALSIAPATAAGLTAHAAGNEAESASGAVYSFVKSKYAQQASGRGIETTCSGRKSPYSCTWWIIKKSSEKRRATQASLLLRSGEGNLHANWKRVFRSGYASAAYNSRSGGFTVTG